MRFRRPSALRLRRACLPIHPASTVKQPRGGLLFWFPALIAFFSLAGLLRYEKAYKNEIDHFIGLLLQEVKEPRVLPEDPLKGALIAEAAKESLRTKERIFL